VVTRQAAIKPCWRAVRQAHAVAGSARQGVQHEFVAILLQHAGLEQVPALALWGGLLRRP